MNIELKVGDIVEKDGQQFEYIGDGKLKPISVLTKRFLDEKGEFHLHRGLGLNEILDK